MGWARATGWVLFRHRPHRGLANGGLHLLSLGRATAVSRALAQPAPVAPRFRSGCAVVSRSSAPDPYRPVLGSLLGNVSLQKGLRSP
jgi:hypothetical protein